MCRKFSAGTFRQEWDILFGGNMDRPHNVYCHMEEEVRGAGGPGNYRESGREVARYYEKHGYED